MNSGKFLMVLWMACSVSGFAHASSDYAADDMLTESRARTEDRNTENENADNVVRWGVSRIKKVEQKLEPISEDAFGPADPMAPATTGRSPAAVAQAKAAEDEEKKLAAKTIVRNLAKKKAFQEMSVIVNDLGFFPSTLFVTQGIPVRLYVTGASKKSQCFMMDNYGIRRQIQASKIEEIMFTPDETGSFTFSCPMNGAKGTMLVKELELDRMPANISIKVSQADLTDEEAEAEAKKVAEQKAEQRANLKKVQQQLH